MAEYGGDLEQLEDQLRSLEDNVAGTAQVTAVFQQELLGVQNSISLAEKEARGFSRSLSRGMRGALGDVILEGAKFSDVLHSMAQTMIRNSFNQAVTPVTDAVGGILTGGINSIFGGLFSNASAPKVTPFAQGGVVSGATSFPMRGGLGVMGEAGPEAILPLQRGSNGRLGVSGGAQSHVHVTMNITTPDVESFKRSQAQVAAGLSRAMARGNRNQ